jgi:2'-5' RNA ligase
MAYIGIEIIQSASFPLSTIPEAQLHLTLVHFEKPTEEQVQRMLPSLRSFADMPPSVITRGRERFHGADVLLVEKRPALMLLREASLKLLEAVGVALVQDYEFNPHITVGALNPETLPVFEPLGWMQMLMPTAIELAGTRAVVRYRFPFRVDTLDATSVVPR